MKSSPFLQATTVLLGSMVGLSEAVIGPTCQLQEGYENVVVSAPFAGAPALVNGGTITSLKYTPQSIGASLSYTSSVTYTVGADLGIDLKALWSSQGASFSKSWTTGTTTTQSIIITCGIQATPWYVYNTGDKYQSSSCGTGKTSNFFNVTVPADIPNATPATQNVVAFDPCFVNCGHNTTCAAAQIAASIPGSTTPSAASMYGFAVVCPSEPQGSVPGS